MKFQFSFSRMNLPSRCCLLFAILLHQLGILAAAQEVIRLQGSDTMLRINQAWAQGYGVEHPKMKVEVVGGGSGLGISALMNRKTDIAAASRPLKDAERKQASVGDAGPIEIEVALDALAIYVHDSNPVSRLSLEQLRGIFDGTISNWSEVGGKDLQIALYSRNTDSGTHDFFQEFVLGEAEFHKSTQFLPSTAAVTTSVSRNLRGIGYGGIGYAEGVRSVRVVDPESKVAVEPSSVNVITELYPLSRPLYFYVHPEAWTPEVEAFALWVLSARGQQIVSDEHFYPLPKSRRKIVGSAPPTRLNPKP